LKTFFIDLFKARHQQNNIIKVLRNMSFASPFDLPYDSPLNLPSTLPVIESKQDEETSFLHVPYVESVIEDYDLADGTCMSDPATWEYWVWEKHMDYISSKYYYYSPHYDVSTYDVPERNSSLEDFEDVVIKDGGAELWYKYYRKSDDYPHNEAYYHNRRTGEIRTDMPKRGYVQVLREYETIDKKGVRKTYLSVQFPKLPPLPYQQK